MLLQRLNDYAEHRLQLPPAMYQERPIRYLIDLDQDGRMLGPPVDTADPATRATRRGVRRLAPHVKRSSAVKPKLLADTGVYALGIPTADTRPDRLRQQHDAFVTLVDACAQATAAPEVEAVASFLADLDPAGLPLPADFDPKADLTFRVEGVFPIDLPTVREFWAAIHGPEDAEGDQVAVTSVPMPCIVCGRVRPALPRHPLKVKGIPGPQTSGTDLISANEQAYQSYGLANSLIAPTCQPCAERYGNALNALLADPATHLRVGSLVYAYWTAGETDFNPGSLFSDPDPREVGELIASWRTGRAAATDIDPTAFFAVTLGASGGRAMVRSWIDTTVGEAKRRLARYFALQRLVARDGGPWVPLPVWRLAGATVRDPRKETPPASVPRALLELGLGGQPLALDLLFQAVRRNRAEQGVSTERAALVKMVLGSQPGITQGVDAMVQLDLTNTAPAYLCGRLLAILDAIQQRALNNPNATIVDRYYGTASSAPAAVFGTLLHGAQPHLAKLRKDPRTHGAFRALEERLEAVMAELTSFPSTLTLQEQGLFALGFYHQRAEDRRARRERGAANAAGAADIMPDAEANLSEA